MKALNIMLVLVTLGLLTACAGKAPYHSSPMPDPKTFNAHFGNIDTGGDELLNRNEFKTHFPHATDAVFKAIDLNGDDRIDHDEWHRFKEAHGLKHHE